MKILQALILAFSILCFENTFAFENNFFVMDVPETWAHKSYSDTDPAPFKLDYFYKDNCQFFYTFVSKQIPSPMDVINVHIERKLDKTGLESMCKYSEVVFCGLKSICYSFVGSFAGSLYGRGKAYCFLSHGCVFLFVNFFIPDVIEGRKEVEIFETIELKDPSNWIF